MGRGLGFPSTCSPGGCGWLKITGITVLPPGRGPGAAGAAEAAGAAGAGPGGNLAPAKGCSLGGDGAQPGLVVVGGRGAGHRQGLHLFSPTSLQACSPRIVLLEQIWAEGWPGSQTCIMEGDQPGCSGGSGLLPAQTVFGGDPHIHAGQEPLHTLRPSTTERTRRGAGIQIWAPGPSLSLPCDNEPPTPHLKTGCACRIKHLTPGHVGASSNRTSSICLERQHQFPVTPLVQG